MQIGVYACGYRAENKLINKHHVCLHTDGYIVCGLHQRFCLAGMYEKMLRWRYSTYERVHVFKDKSEIKSQRCQIMFQRWQYRFCDFTLKRLRLRFTFKKLHDISFHFCWWINLNSCHLILRCCGQQNLIFCWHDTEGGFYPQWYFTNGKKTHSLIF